MELSRFIVILGALLLHYGHLVSADPPPHAPPPPPQQPPSSCGTTKIRTAEDASQLRTNCPIIHGNLTIESSKETPSLFDLTGVEVIEGQLETECQQITGPGGPGFGPCVGMFDKNSSTGTPTTIYAPDLKEIRNGLMLSGKLMVKNFTAPNLKTVGGWMFVTGNTLEYLDVTSLEEVGYVTLVSSGIKELKLDGIKRLTGGKFKKKEITVYGLPNLKSVDSILSAPVELDSLEFDQETTDLESITIGATFAKEVQIKGKGKLKVVFGTAETTKMDLQMVKIRGVSDIVRANGAQNVTVQVFDLQHNEFKRLKIPFDDLGMLYMMYESSLETLVWTEKTKDYTNLTVAIWDCDKLNLESEWGEDEQGKKIKTWWWPEKDMGIIAIYNIKIDESLFDSLIDYRLSIPDPAKRPKIKSINLWPPAKDKHSLDCTGLKKLGESGVVEEDVVCDGFDDGSGTGVRMGALSSLIWITISSMVFGLF